MGISIWQLVIILAIVLVLFGAKRLRNVGGDLGAAVRGFKTAVKEGKEDDKEEVVKNIEEKSSADDDVLEGEVIKDEKDKT